MHQKDFQHWAMEKEKIHFSDYSIKYPKAREIWYVKMGVNIGCEEDGKHNFLRPVLVLKKIGSVFFCVALTSKGKQNHLFYHHIQEVVFNDSNKKYKDSSYVIVSQVKTMDIKRFTENMGRVSVKEFEIIKRKLKDILL